MATSAPSSSVERPSNRPACVPDEEAVARWAAWYEGLPDDLREALDERGRSSAKGAPER